MYGYAWIYMCINRSVKRKKIYIYISVQIRKKVPARFSSSASDSKPRRFPSRRYWNIVQTQTSLLVACLLLTVSLGVLLSLLNPVGGFCVDIAPCWCVGCHVHAWLANALARGVAREFWPPGLLLSPLRASFANPIRYLFQQKSLSHSVTQSQFSGCVQRWVFSENDTENFC